MLNIITSALFFALPKERWNSFKIPVHRNVSFLDTQVHFPVGLGKSAKDAKKNRKLSKNPAVLIKINAFSRKKSSEKFCF